MPASFLVFVAVRHIVARLRSTLLILLGVGVGVFVMTVMQSMMGGFQGELVRILYTTVPSILVKGKPRGPTNEGRLFAGSPGRPGRPGTLFAQDRLKPSEKETGIRNYGDLTRRIEGMEGVVAVAPFVQGRAMLRFGTRERGANVLGVQTTSYDRVVEFRSKVDGDPDDLVRRRDGIILGSILAEEMGISKGNRVQLVGAEGATVDLRVLAFFKSGITTVDRTFAFINLPVGQSLMGYPGAATGIAIKAAPAAEYTAMARRVEYAVGLETQSWEEQNANFFGIIGQQNRITYSAVGLTVLVAGFGIANGLITAVLEKRRDIGILRTLGLTPRAVGMVFLLEGMIMGLLGCVIGLLAAAWMMRVLEQTPLAGRGGLASVTHFIMRKDTWVFISSGVFAFLVSAFASLFPSIRAARYDPVEIIRTAK